MSRESNAGTMAIAVLLAVLIAAALWGTARTEIGVEQAVRRNFTAAGWLSRLQVEGEKMRRFEKEMFIYAAVPDKRKGYVKEFDAAHDRLLELLDRMLAPSGTAFDDGERAEMFKWKAALAFYTAEFARIARRAESLSGAALSSEQRAALTLESNEAIKDGKDRFRELLSGTEKMRAAKETQAQNIAGELESLFGRLRGGLLLGGLLGVAVVLLGLRSRRRAAASAVARPQAAR